MKHNMLKSMMGLSAEQKSILFDLIMRVSTPKEMEEDEDENDLEDVANLVGTDNPFTGKEIKVASGHRNKGFKLL